MEHDLQFLQQNMFVIPVPFAKEMLEYKNGQVAINPKFTMTSYNDCFDAFGLSLMFWH
jgi:hypothetical protein